MSFSFHNQERTWCSMRSKLSMLFVCFLGSIAWVALASGASNNTGEILWSPITEGDAIAIKGGVPIPTGTGGDTCSDTTFNKYCDQTKTCGGATLSCPQVVFLRSAAGGFKAKNIVQNPNGGSCSVCGQVCQTFDNYSSYQPCN